MSRTYGNYATRQQARTAREEARKEAREGRMQARAASQAARVAARTAQLTLRAIQREYSDSEGMIWAHCYYSDGSYELAHVREGRSDSDIARIMGKEAS